MLLQKSYLKFTFDLRLGSVRALEKLAGGHARRKYLSSLVAWGKNIMREDSNDSEILQFIFIRGSVII
ncbi:hypothetical protein Q7C36_006848 [Tachysurus vachellii]|uniref:Uncharacterized protein n=1 Tax=Tachysurus vachellii TaxID=175792 RepID=A0AA88NK98_TACVA|nr:hypothetical protein Q7C36_006848 [Tachysurus vachellii]